jgi:hypothetical protein
MQTAVPAREWRLTNIVLDAIANLADIARMSTETAIEHGVHGVASGRVELGLPSGMPAMLVGLQSSCGSRHD